MTKYISHKTDKINAQNIYDSIPTFLAKVNNRYMLSNIDKNARYTNYQSSIKSLITTRIIYKVNNLSSFTSPIKMHNSESEFKIYYNDCGFLSQIFNINKTILVNNDSTYANIKGSIAENFIIVFVTKNNRIINALVLDNFF